MKDQLDAQASARLSAFLNTPAMRSRLIQAVPPGAFSLPDGSTTNGGGTPPPAQASAGMPGWAIGVGAFALAVGATFFVWRK